MFKARTLITVALGLLPILFVAANCRQRLTKNEGLIKQYYDNGSIMSEVMYKDGVKNGRYRSWYDNGQLHGEGTYKNDSLVGAAVLYYKNGIKNSELAWNENHELHGPSRFWNESGILLDSGRYRNGKFEGRWWRYFGTGKLAQVKNFSNGLLDGISVDFKENGDTLKVSKYHLGALISTKNY